MGDKDQEWWNEKMGVITKDVEPAFTPPVNEFGMIQGEDTIQFNNQLTFGPAPTPLMTFTSTSTVEPNTITICSNGKEAVTLNLETGGLEYGDDYIPSEAAEIFWDAVSANTPAIAIKKENDELKAKLKQMETKYGEHLTGQLKYEDGDTLQWSADLGDWVNVKNPSSEDKYREMIRKGGYKEEIGANPTFAEWIATYPNNCSEEGDDEWSGKMRLGSIDPDASVYYQDNSDNANYFWDLRAGMNNNDWATFYGDNEEPQTWLRILYDEDHNDPCAITVEDGGINGSVPALSDSQADLEYLEAKKAFFAGAHNDVSTERLDKQIALLKDAIAIYHLKSPPREEVPALSNAGYAEGVEDIYLSKKYALKPYLSVDEEVEETESHLTAYERAMKVIE